MPYLTLSNRVVVDGGNPKTDISLDLTFKEEHLIPLENEIKRYSNENMYRFDENVLKKDRSFTSILAPNFTTSIHAPFQEVKDFITEILTQLEISNARK